MESLFDILPHELLEILLRELNGDELLDLYQIFYNVADAMESDALWKRLFKNKFGELNSLLDINYDLSIIYLISSYERASWALREADIIINNLKIRYSLIRRPHQVESNFKITFVNIVRLISLGLINMFSYKDYSKGNSIEIILTYDYPSWKLLIPGNPHPTYFTDVEELTIHKILFSYVFEIGSGGY
jgi:hypothetical protein